MRDLGGIPDPVLIVSPHFDDAALSCAAILDRGAGAHVLTVLGGSPDPPVVGWSERHMGFPSSRETMAARRAEDERVWAESGHRVEVMELLDEDYLPGARRPEDPDLLCKRVEAWCDGHPEGSVALPVGAGRRRGRVRARVEGLIGLRGGVLQHDDHLFVRDALLGPSLAARRTVALYEELPYLWGGRGDGEATRLARAHGVEARLVEVPVDRERKAARIGLYESQIEQLWAGGRLDDPELLPSSERYWILERPAGGA